MNHLLSEVAGEGCERLMEVMAAIKSEVTDPMTGCGLVYVKCVTTYPIIFGCNAVGSSRRDTRQGSDGLHLEP